MRISEILLQFLISQKKLSLTGLGTIYLNTTPYTDHIDESFEFPENSLTFEVDVHTPEDEALIAEIASVTGKIKALAAADLDTYIIAGKQMMNISKPFVIDKIGILERNYLGKISFIPHYAVKNADEKYKITDVNIEEIRFDDNYLLKFRKIKHQYKRIILPLASILFMGLIFIAIYYFITHYSKANSAEDKAPISTNNDTYVIRKDSSNQNKTNSFYIVLEIAKKERAQTRFNDLLKWGHDVQLITQDSINFKLRIPINAPLADSSKHKDSLARFFDKQVWVERQ